MKHFYVCSEDIHDIQYSRNVGTKRNVSMKTQSNAEELETSQIGKCLFVDLINTID